MFRRWRQIFRKLFQPRVVYRYRQVNKPHSKDELHTALRSLYE